MSDPKRATLDSVSAQSPNTSDTGKTPLDSAADLFPGQSEGQRDRFSLSVQEEPNNRKRKEIEEHIEMDELESIMSLDMDLFDEPPAVNSQPGQPFGQNSHEEKRSVEKVEASTSSKRQRLEENGTDRRQQRDVKKESSGKPVQPPAPIKTEEPHPLDNSSPYRQSSKRPQSSFSTTRTNVKAFEEVEVSCSFLYSILLWCSVC